MLPGDAGAGSRRTRRHRLHGAQWADGAGRTSDGTGMDSGTGHRGPLALKTLPQTSEYEMGRHVGDRDVIVCQVGKTVLHDKRALEDLRDTRKPARGRWAPQTSRRTRSPAPSGLGQVGRQPDRRRYGLKGLRGRFGMYLPPLMEGPAR